MLKQTNISGLVPTSAQLKKTELGYNSTDNKLFANVNGTIKNVTLSLDAETLGGLKSSQFLRSDQSDEMIGDLTLKSSSSNRDTALKLNSSVGTRQGYFGRINSGSVDYMAIHNDAGNSTIALYDNGDVKFSGINKFVMQSDSYIDFDPNSTWGAQLRVGGNGHTDTSKASVCTTNGNLHLDSKRGSSTYLNNYSGSNVMFGNGNGFVAAIMDSSGQLYKGSSSSSGIPYALESNTVRAWNPLPSSGATSGWAKLITIDDASSNRGMIQLTGRGGYGQNNPSNTTGCTIYITDGNNNPDRNINDLNIQVFNQGYDYQVAKTLDGSKFTIWVKFTAYTTIMASYIGNLHNVIFESNQHQPSPTAGYVLATAHKIWTDKNDGSGSGLDADLLGGVQSSTYMRKDNTNYMNSSVIFNANKNAFLSYKGISGLTGGWARGVGISDKDGVQEGGFGFYGSATADGKLNANRFVATGNKTNWWDESTAWFTAKDDGLYHKGSKVITTADSGSGSGFDADTVDGIHVSQLARKDQSNVISGNNYLDFGPNTSYKATLRVGGNGHTDSGKATVCTTDGNLHLDGKSAHKIYLNFYTGDGVIFGDGNSNPVANIDKTGQLYKGSYKYYHQGFKPSKTDVGLSNVPNYPASNTYTSGAAHLATRTAVYNAWVNAKAVSLPRAGGTVTGTVKLNDNVRLDFGSGNDARFYCNGSHMYIDLQSGIGNLYIQDGGTTRFTFDDAGHFTATGNITAYSDKRIKSNIKRIENPLEKINQISGYTFNRNDLEYKKDTGVLAQEIEKVLPEVITEIDSDLVDGKLKTVDYGKISGLLIECIKELKKEINELKGQA